MGEMYELIVMSSPLESQSSGIVDTLLNVELLVYLVVISTLAILADVLVLNLFGIQTVTDAVTVFLIMTVGGYIGQHLIDVVRENLFGN